MLFNIDAIARSHGDVFRLIFKAKNGAALQENNPFMVILVIPEAVRRAMTTGNNPFNPATGCLQNRSTSSSFRFSGMSVKIFFAVFICVVSDRIQMY
jgi:hypothetical protein